jgi:hypothetical protein
LDVFEQVIIGTPPVNAYGDVLMVSKVVDAAALLCGLKLTEGTGLPREIQRFEDAWANY